MKPSFFCLALVLLIQNSFTLITSQKHFNLTTDESALLAFKIAITSDPSGVSSKNWSTNIPICSWIGVSCSSKHRRVTALNVSGLGLLGTITPHLGNLTFLQFLDISSNNFTGSIPSQLSNLRRLKVLDLGFNKLAGEIPAWIGNFSYLEMLSLASNYFSGSIPNGVFNISSLIEVDMRFNMLSSKLPYDICDNATPKLKRIILPGNQLYGEIPTSIYRCRELEQIVLLKNYFNGNIPSEIGRLSKLQLLAIWSNGFSGSIPKEIGHMPSLKYLDLSNNNLEGNIPSSILDNSSLIFVNLSNNSLSGSIPTLNHLQKLEELYLSINNLTGSIPAHFGNLTSMRRLSFYKNNLKGELPQELGNLINLEYFSVEDNSLSGSIPSSIFNMSSLNSIRMSSNALSGNLPRLLLFNLEELWVDMNKLDGVIPSSINNASKLTLLSLSNNSFSGFIPDFGNLRLLFRLGLWGNNLMGAESPTQELGFLSSLANCQYLERLELSLNPINGILPTSIGNLSSSLGYFSAFKCNIGGVIPSEIGNLSSLLYVHLHENRMTGFIPTSFGKLAKLQKLYLGSNQFQGFIPSELCQMSNLGELDLSGNMITQGIPECLGELTSLSMINFGSNKLNSTISSSFWNLTNLVSLNLSSNYLSGEISSEIRKFKTIVQIDLSSNQFSGDITSLIDGCQSLEVLNLSNNRFGGSIPQSLKNIRGLRVLNFSNNNLSGLIPKSLEDLSLQYFNVSHNKLEGEIPNGGCFVNFTAQSFVYNSALCGATRFQVPPCVENLGGSRLRSVVRLMKFILPVLVSTIIIVIVIIVFIRRRNHKSIPTMSVDTLVSVEWKRISYIELERGTNSFSETNLLGRGSVGSVFKATLFDGLNVAVKVFNLQLEGTLKSFDTESKILSTIRHRNLVRVIGCCSNTEFKALILSYMPNGSLDKWLHSDSYCLDLIQRLNIAIHVALALEYLHHGHTYPIVHCDIKPSNVLLDEDMTAHVGDFGISKLFEDVVVTIQTKTLATIGYAAPEYGMEGKVSTNGDVYSYGILLLEILTGKRPTDDIFDAELSLREWVSNATQNNAGIEILALNLLSTEDEHFSAKTRCALSIFELAMKCLVVSPEERINMIEVGAILHRIKARVVVDTMGNNVN